MQRFRAERVLRETGWLSRQPPAFQEGVLERALLERYRAGSTIYSSGDQPHDIWGLVAGTLTVLATADLVLPNLIYVARPGWWIGDTALITVSPRRVTLSARGDCWLMRLSVRAINQLARQDPDTWRRVAQITVGHLDHALRIISELSVRNSRARVALALVRLVDLEGTSTGPTMIRLSQDELGEMTRLTRNAVAPILSDLEAAGLIKRNYRGLAIPDIAALSRYAEARATA